MSGEKYPAPLSNVNAPSSEEQIALLRSPSDLMRSPMTKRLMTKKLLKKGHSGEAGKQVPMGIASGMMQPASTGLMHPSSPSDNAMSPCSRRLRKPGNADPARSKGGKASGTSKLKSSLLSQYTEPDPPTPRPPMVYLVSNNTHKCEIALSSNVLGEQIKILGAHCTSGGYDSDENDYANHMMAGIGASPSHSVGNASDGEPLSPPTDVHNAVAPVPLSSIEQEQSATDEKQSQGSPDGRSGGNSFDNPARGELSQFWQEQSSVTAIELSMLTGAIARKKVERAIVTYAETLRSAKDASAEEGADGSAGGEVLLFATCTIAARVLSDKVHVHPVAMASNSRNRTSNDNASGGPVPEGRIPRPKSGSGRGNRSSMFDDGDADSTTAADTQELELLPIVEDVESGRTLLRSISNTTIVLYTAVACVNLSAQHQHWRSELAVTELAIGGLSDDVINGIIDNATQVQQSEKELASRSGATSQARAKRRTSTKDTNDSAEGSASFPSLTKLAMARQCLGGGRLFTAACALPVDDDEFMAAVAVVGGSAEGVNGLPLEEASSAVAGVTGADSRNRGDSSSSNDSEL